MLKETDLKEYQLRAIDYVVRKKRCGLAIEMGLGKTIIALTAFLKIRKDKDKLLIIAPLNTAKVTWHNEIASWSHTQNLTVSKVLGDVRARCRALEKDVDVYVINQENVKWLYETLKKPSFKMIVVDESQGFKNPMSKRFKYLKLFKYEYIALLTGTPCPQNLLDMYSQQYLIDEGKKLGKFFTHYKEKFFIYDEYRYTYRERYPDLINKILSDHWMTMLVDDYLTLPDLISNKIITEIDNFKTYQKFEKEFILKIKDEKITAVNAGVLSNKLLQYCNGAVYKEDGSYEEVHSNKIDMLEQIVSNYENENLLVAYNFRCDLERIKKRFPDAVVLDTSKTEEIVDDWNNNKIKMLLCQCGQAKGLNLQKGGRIIVWFGLTWNLESYLQFNARLYRKGQTKPVVIHHIVAKDCKDSKVMHVLAKKNITQETLFKYLKLSA